MPRPDYETDADRSRELRAVNSLCAKLAYTPHKLSKHYPLDFALIDKESTIKAFVEIKCRNQVSNSYSTVFVTLNKVERARAISRTSRIPAYLLVDFKDGQFMLPFSAPIEYVAIGGRTDRGDKLDMEPVAHFRIDQMSRLSIRQLPDA